jgi:hypothetical protein
MKTPHGFSFSCIGALFSLNHLLPESTITPHTLPYRGVGVRVKEDQAQNQKKFCKKNFPEKKFMEKKKLWRHHIIYPPMVRRRKSLLEKQKPFKTISKDLWKRQQEKCVMLHSASETEELLT